MADKKKIVQGVVGCGCLLAIVFAVIVFMSIAGMVWTNLTKPSTQPSAQPVASTLPTPEIVRSDRTISLAKYEKIRPGMYYREVLEIMQVPGTELSRVHSGGIPAIGEPAYDTVAYSWQNLDGSNMNVMTQKEKVVSKAQFGLR